MNAMSSTAKDISNTSPAFAHDDVPELAEKPWQRLVDVMLPIAAGLKKDYPTLSPYLVLTHSGADSPLPDRFSSLLKKIPQAFVDNESKKLARGLLAKNQTLPHDLIEALRIKSDSCLELRFQHLDYPQIWRMQSDPRVDPTRTPKTKASIRIVLGVLHQLARASEEASTHPPEINQQQIP